MKKNHLLARVSATNTEMEQSGIEVVVMLLADEWRW